MNETSSQPIPVSDLHDVVRDSLAIPELPYDLAIVRPPRHLKARLRPYAVIMPQFGMEEFTWGYEELKHFNSIVVLIVYSDLAADYHVKEDVTKAIRAKLENVHGAGCCGSDNYMVSRKEIATLSSLGKIGRNGIFFSRKFGFNCKIDFVPTFLEFESYTSTEQIPQKWKLGPCLTCDVCVERCPVSAYQDFRMVDVMACEKHITPDWNNPERLCRECTTSCPPSATLLDRLYAKGASRSVMYESGRVKKENFVLRGEYNLNHAELTLSDLGGACVTDLNEEEVPYIQWMMEQRNSFSRSLFALAFPDTPKGDVAGLFDSLEFRGVIEGWDPHAELAARESEDA